MKKLNLLTIALALAASASAQKREYTPSPVSGCAWNTPGALNPFIPGYFADPTIRKFGDTYYVYATTDGTGNGYGPAQVWMSKDFVNWKNFVMNWPTTEVVWAPDVVQQPNGKYRYFYCEPCNINIGESDSPVGPWKNILGKEDAVMVPDRYIHNVITLDPMLFRDDDGAQYLYFTTWGIYKGFGCGVAKLKDGDYDITALAENVRKDARRWNENNPFPIAADEFFTEKKLITNDELKDIFEAPFVFKKDGIYYFTYSSGSCHTDTYRVQYATSKTGPMGPFEYKGEILTTNTDGTVHGPGHHSILVQDGKYYIVYHRHNNPKSIHGFNRQVCIDQLEFDANGNIKPVTPTHDGINPLAKKSKHKNLAYGAQVTASSYYDSWFKPEYATDDNNATLWKAKHSTWDAGSLNECPEWIEIDLGKEQKFNEIWTQFEYATFFYQYTIETSADGKHWSMYADRRSNTNQGSPMIDKGNAKARYILISIYDTQKNGHLPAIWNVKVWNKAPELPTITAESNDAYPGMHKFDVTPEERHAQENKAFIAIDIAEEAKEHNDPFDITELKCTTNEHLLSPQMHKTVSKPGQETNPAGMTRTLPVPPVSPVSTITFKANKPIHARVKDGRWALFFNGTQSLTSSEPLPSRYAYNSPYTISFWALPTEIRPVGTILSLSSSRADLANTEIRLGTDPSTGLINHNGSFESTGAPEAVKAGLGKWQHWVITYDGWMERVYCNGKLIKEKNNFLMIRTQGHITIGADASGANNFMGYISNIQIVPMSIDASAVSDIYDKSKNADLKSLGDDDFEEIDPDSKFTLFPNAKQETPKATPFRLSAGTANFNDDPFANGAEYCRDITGDFVAIVKVTDMEGLLQRKIKGYNEGGIIIADGDTYYQLGAFPLYNCGNMFTILSNRGRPQYPNYKGYNFDQYMQFERRGNQLFARSSADGTTWNNMPGSPVTIQSPTVKVGTYQTTYSAEKSWVEFSELSIYTPTAKGKSTAKSKSSADKIAAFSAPKGKEIYIPRDLRSNDFTKESSKWSYARCAYTDDIIVFWEKPFGKDLSNAPDLEGKNMKVNLKNLLARLQSFYNFYKNDLKFIKQGSNADRYRMMVMLNYSLEGTAYGGDYDNTIGALWIAPNRVQDEKLNCIAHELGHSFQSQISCDKQGESWGGGGIFEMASQWMLFNVNPEWPTDENYHWKDFIKNANLRFLDATNIYHSPYMLEYWSMKRGKTVIADLFRQGKCGEDPMSTYMRMFSLSTEDAAHEAVDCYSRLLTFDFPGKKVANKKYAGEFLNQQPLQMYGANVIQLPLPDTFGGTALKDIPSGAAVSIELTFEGADDNDGYACRIVTIDNAGNAEYGKTQTGTKSSHHVNLNRNTKAAYLVVTGYPKGEYKPYLFNPYDRKSKSETPHIYKYNYKANNIYHPAS